MRGVPRIRAQARILWEARQGNPLDEPGMRREVKAAVRQEEEVRLVWSKDREVF